MTRGHLLVLECIEENRHRIPTRHSPTDYGETFELHPREQFASFQPPSPFLPRSPGIHEEWLRGILTGAQPMASFDYAAPFTGRCCWATWRCVTGQRIEMDAAAMRVVNDEAAQRFSAASTSEHCRRGP
ncbi:MAG TPA: hypothetical protein VFD82_06700 [Planctomycetota bacterium]|nr:hypothetical protein [Planctomycetota bacterium]